MSPGPRRGHAMVRDTLAYWIATGSTLIGGLLRGKVAAVILGVDGVGITAQLATATALISAVAAVGVGSAGIKLIAGARAHGDEDSLAGLTSFILWFPAMFGVVLFAGASLVSEPTSRVLLGSGEHRVLVIVALASVPLNCLLASVQVIMQGHELARRLSISSVVAVLLNTATAVLLTVAYGVSGAVWSIPIGAALSLSFFCFRERWIVRAVWPLRMMARDDRSEFTRIGGASVLAAGITLTIDTALRSLTVHELGLDQNGLYQPAQTMTTVIFGQLAGALTLVLLPRLAHELTVDRGEQAKRTLSAGAESALVLAVPLCLLAAASAELLVVVFFDRDFLPAASVVAVQSTAELPRLVAYVLGAVLIPAGLVRYWLLSSIFGNAARLLVTLLLFDALGLYALALGVLVMWAFTFCWTAAVLNRKLGWRPTPRFARLAVPAMVVVAIGVLMSEQSSIWSAGTVALALLWVGVVGRHEVRLVVRAHSTRSPAAT